MSENTPKSVDLLKQLAILKIVKGWTCEDIRTRLNEHLAKKIKDSRNGRGQIDRWINTDRNGWVEPRGEVILAVQEVLRQHP